MNGRETALEIDTLSELAGALAAHDAERVRLARAAAVLDARGEWALDGAVSMTAWLRARLRMLDDDAADLLRPGRFCERFSFGDAVADGTLSWGQATLMRRAVRPTAEGLLDEQHAEMVETLAQLDIAQTKIACRVWKAHADALVDPAPKDAAPAEVSFAVDDTGQACGRFVLSPMGTLQFEKALATATSFLGADDDRRPAERRAQAWEDICAFFNANHDRAGTPRHRSHVELVSDPDGIVRTVDGRVVDEVCADTLMCDCVVHRVLKTGSSILDYGHATRTVPLALFRSIALRDGGCRFPGCDRPVAWTEAHHVRFWRHHGPTRLENLLLLCSRHHHIVHRPDWELTLHPDATVTVTTPDGVIMTSRPRGSPPTRPRLGTAA